MGTIKKNNRTKGKGTFRIKDTANMALLYCRQVLQMNSQEMGRASGCIVEVPVANAYGAYISTLNSALVSMDFRRKNNMHCVDNV